MFNINKKNTRILNISIILLSTLIIFGGFTFLTKGKSILKADGYTNYIGEVTGIVGTETTDETLGIVKTDVSVKILNKDLKGQEVVASQLSGALKGYDYHQIKVGEKFLVNNSIGGWALIEPYRVTGLTMLLGVFFIGLLIIGKKNGIKTIISLCITCGAVFMLFIPSILAGYNIYISAILTAIFITLTTLPLVSGYTKKSLAAAVGCVGGVIAVALITVIMNKLLNLTGISNQESILLVQNLSIANLTSIDLKGIVFASIILGALGATMDVAISIASSLYELCKEVKDVTFKKALTSGLNIGKDIMGTMTNTLILAYIGSSLTGLLLLLMNGGTFVEIINREFIATEILQSLAGSIGMLLTIPITAVVATALYLKVKSKKSDRDILNS